MDRFVTCNNCGHVIDTLEGEKSLLDILDENGESDYVILGSKHRQDAPAIIKENSHED